MKITMRAVIFETNSSATHSLTMCTPQEFEDWKEGKLLYENGWYQGKFIFPDEANWEEEEADWRYLTYEDVFDLDGKIEVNHPGLKSRAWMGDTSCFLFESGT